MVRKGQSKSRENFQARRRNYIGSEWNISSTSPPFDEIEREGRANSPSSSSRSPLSVPPQLRIINGQFAASAADCIVSLFSGFPSFRCQALSLCLSLFIFPSSSLSFARIRTPQSLELPPLSTLPPALFPQILPFFPSSFPNPSKFVKGSTSVGGSRRYLKPACPGELSSPPVSFLFFSERGLEIPSAR